MLQQVRVTDAVVFGKLIKHEYHFTKEGVRKMHFFCIVKLCNEFEFLSWNELLKH